jgi:phosphoribosylaminoimidazole-succinocarboxamide synthase
MIEWLPLRCRQDGDDVVYSRLECPGADMALVSPDLWRASFDELPLLAEGESKIVRIIDERRVIVRLKPTLYSYSANRAAVVEGTEKLRLSISRRLWALLESQGVPTTITHVGDDYYISRRVDPPPIEVIVKAALIGTPKHVYKGLERFPTRLSTRLLSGERHEPYVRFDWRNPLPDRDECMPLWLADQFIDTKAAEKLALRAFAVLSEFLSDRGIDLLDICFFVSRNGDSLFGEVSPDCMRAKYRLTDLDKDVWRKGKDADTVRSQWTKFLQLIQEAC